MKKRLVAFIMALAMVLTMVPIVVLAEQPEPFFPTVAPENEVYTMLENENGSYVDEGGGSFFKYSYPNNLFIIAQDVNVGMSIWTTYYQDREWSYDNVSYSLKSNINEIQTVSNPWIVGNEYDILFYWVNNSTGDKVKDATTVKVRIIENPLIDVEYDSYSVDAFAYSNGCYEKDSNGNVNFVYRTDSLKPILVSATSVGDVVSVMNGSLKLDDQWYNSNVVLTQPLTVGSNAVKISVLGVEKDYTINLKNPGIKDRIDWIEVFDVELEEGTNYNLYPKFVVHYKDGTVGYSSDAEYDPWWYSYKDAIDKAEYSVGVFFDVDQSEWTAGSTYKGEMYFLGDTYDFNVTIKPSEIEKIEVNDSVSVPMATNMTNSLEENIKELPIKITYKDGSSETIKYSDLDGISFDGGFFYDPINVDDTCDVAIYYKGVSTNVTAKVVSSEVSSVEIDESSIGKMYYNPNPIQGDPGYDWAAYTGVKGTIYFSDGKSEEITFDYDGMKYISHNGLVYFVDLSSEGDPNQDDVRYVMSVGDIIDYADVEVVDQSVTVKSVECLSKPTKKYYIGDSFFSDCKADFDPHIFVGLKIKVTMTNDDVVILSGDDLHRNSFYDGMDIYGDGGFSNNMFYVLGERNATKTDADLYANILGDEYFICKMTRTESPYKSLEIIEKLTDEQTANFDGTGLKFKLTFKDGREETITLGTPMEGNYGFGCTMADGGYDLDEGFLGDGGYRTPGYDNSISGIKYNVWDISDIIGEQEYATIVWNNGVLRLSDQMVVIDPDKYNSVEGNIDAQIDTVSLSSAVIDSLSLDERFAVEQQGVNLYTSVSADEVDPSNKITVQAKNDDADIKSCYDINFSYLVQGNEYQLTELPNGKIAVTVPLDESLWGLPKDEIVIYREHQYADGVKVEQITDFTISDDGKFITFESDKFSTFALGYKDKKDVPPGGNGGTNNEKPTLPEAVEKIANTLDNTPVAATMMLVCSSGLCLFAVSRKRKELE